MIITRTPFRISFFGGSTDYPSWYNVHGGAVLNTTINKYCYVMCRHLPPYFKYNYRIRYRLNEMVKEISEIKHNSVRECLKFMDIKQGIEMVHTADIPARSGIGSSSAFTVGFLHALTYLNGEITTKRQLALNALEIEQNILKENVGAQDQTASAFGGLNKIIFGGQKTIEVQPIVLGQKRFKKFQEHVMLFFTGFSRTASEVAGKYIKTLPQKEKYLNIMTTLVDNAIEILQDGVIEDFGLLLDETWKLKKQLSNNISNDHIDNLYQKAKDAGAVGGKLAGAGGGGFFILFAKPEYHEHIKKVLHDYLYVPFKFDTIGSQMIFYNSQEMFP